MRSDNQGASDIEKFLKLDRSGVDSLDLGLPEPSFFKRWQEGLAALTLPGEWQYASPSETTKNALLNILPRYEGQYISSEVVICSGSQEAIFLLAMHLLSEKRFAIVDEFFYPNFKTALNNLGKDVVPVKSSQYHGFDLDQLESILKERTDIGCIYTVPNGHNPQGWSLSIEKRKQLASLAVKHNVPIIEDDPYRLINFSDIDLPSIKSFAPDHVYYVSTLSKIIAPSLRIGWITAPRKEVERINRLKEGVNLNTITYTHTLATYFLNSYNLTEHLRHLNSHYVNNRNLMINAVKKFFPENSQYICPNHGFFIWVRIPGFNSLHKLEHAFHSMKVTYIPGSVFSTKESINSNEYFRLCYSNIHPDRIDNAIERLSTLFS
jgi:2-aminoadipate transaminase